MGIYVDVNTAKKENTICPNKHFFKIRNSNKKENNKLKQNDKTSWAMVEHVVIDDSLIFLQEICD